MLSKTTERFRKSFKKLPPNIQHKARKSFNLWQENIQHKSLKFKKIHNEKEIYSIYDKLIKNL
jgi:hypothetical protein